MVSIIRCSFYVFRVWIFVREIEIEIRKIVEFKFYLLKLYIFLVVEVIVRFDLFLRVRIICV